MSHDLSLLPRPRHLALTESTLSLPHRRLIVLDSPEPQALRFTATCLQQSLGEHAGVAWEIVAGTAVPADQVGIVLSVLPGGAQHPQGYKLTISTERIRAAAGTAAGAFYAVATLRQILEQRGRDLPTLRIDDWPDFPNRGAMLDVSRDKVPTMETLFDLVDLLAAWKVNQFQLYTEHAFAYRQHPQVWAEATPMTGEEILALDAYCRERFVELVPNQNSFGHMQRWLVHDRYRPLAECPEKCTPENALRGEFLSLCPLDPGSLDLLRSLYDELLPHFSSRHFNVGCDETIDLGLGRSKEAVGERGVGPVYLDFLLEIYREVKARGRTMMFWGDMVMHDPDLLDKLPRDVIALEWGYEAGHPFDNHGGVLAASGVPFYVCPGTSTWNTVAGRTDNALGNLRSAAENGLKHGAGGYLVTDWGDNGHWQPLPVSYLGYAYGAALSWGYIANCDLDVARAISIHAFRDATGTMGRIAYDLGNAYRKPGVTTPNASILFLLLQTPAGEIAGIEGLDADRLRETLSYIDGATAPLPNASMQHGQAGLIRQEFIWAADMLRHACRRSVWALGKAHGAEGGALRRALAEDGWRLRAEFRKIWHARNRPGGFEDSLARLERMRADYEADR